MAGRDREVQGPGGAGWIIKRATRVAAQRVIGPAVTRRLALLVFDSSDGVAPAGARATALRPRRMLFQSGLAAVDFEIRPLQGSQRFSVTGQVRHQDGELAQGVRLEGAGQCYEAPIDGQGVFQLGTVRRGEYAASIHLGTTLLEIPTFVV